MVSRIFIYVLTGTISLWAMAQEDTLYLEELPVYGDSFQRFTTGTGYRSISLTNSSSSLEEALSEENSIYFKSYGNQQLSSISFRGTSASQTSVLWHGIPANYPTLGQMDFSQWPAWLMGRVALQPGSGGALYGPGAIGGTVLIDSELKLADGTLVEAKSSVGSFGYLFTGIKSTYGQGQWRGATKIFRSFLENDFPYEYAGKQVRQKNASVLNYGVQQQLSYRVRSNQELTLDAQYTRNDREVQPSKVSPNLEDELKTGNVRLAGGYQLELPKGSLTSTLAFLQNDQEYNQNDRTISNQYSALVAYWGELSEVLSVRLGGNANFFTATSDNYVNDFVDQQTSIFASLQVNPSDWWSGTVNARQSFYENNRPFTPSFSQKFSVLSTEKNEVFMTNQLSWGFRYPTLNDLHWSPGGNPDLKPEESFNLEGGLDWKYRQSAFSSRLDLTAFKTWSDNWIIWLPDGSGIWSPRNFRTVEITGMELSWEVSGKWGGLLHEFRSAYSYTQSQNEAGTNQGKQLPYTPLHNAHLSLKTSSDNGWYGKAAADFTGRRFTTLDNTEMQSVDEYLLMDVFVGRRFSVSDAFDLELSVAIKNVFDNSYENLINRAMPGRNYQFNLLIKYN
ncbi:TonB-dependent receptor [Marinoscillum sp.]|uniref:TonB-dependent receptor n=1 Tax=Marinoscillum sp. TaxID=2024838 RepID=UPI003BAD7704